MRISDWSSDVCSSDLLVSVELTTMTLATIFNFPWEERAKLTRWSDVTTASPETGIVESFEQRREELIECAMYFKGLWDQRIDQPGGNDLISMMAHSPATRDMPFLEFLGNLLLLIVRSEEHTSELQSLIRTSYAVFCLKQKKH